MGLFDYVRCDVPLPDGEPTPPGLFQTKDFDDPHLGRYAITAEGRLVRAALGGDEDLNWHGYLNFYCGGRGGEWREFNAKFTDGQLVAIEQVPEP